MSASVLHSKILEFAEKDTSKISYASLDQTVGYCWGDIFKKRAVPVLAVYQKGITEETAAKEKKATGILSANMLAHYVSQNMKGVTDVEKFNNILQTPLSKIPQEHLRVHNIEFKDLILEKDATIQQALHYIAQGACAVGVYQNNENLNLFSGFNFLQWLLKNETQLKDFLHQKLEACHHKFTQGVCIVNDKETVLSCIEKVGLTKDWCLAIVNDENKVVDHFGLSQVFMLATPDYHKFLNKPVIEFLQQARETCPDVVHKPLILKKTNSIFDLVSQLTAHSQQSAHRWVHGIVVDDMMKPLVVFNPHDIAHWFIQHKGIKSSETAGTQTTGTSMAT